MLGEGKLPFPSANGGSAEIKLNSRLDPIVHKLEQLIEAIYPDLGDLLQGNYHSSSPQKRYIPGQVKHYKSIDTITDFEDSVHYSHEFLNSSNPSGLPPDDLKLNIGILIMLLRTLNPPNMCNGTSLLIKDLPNNITEAITLTLLRLECSSSKANLKISLLFRTNLPWRCSLCSANYQLGSPLADDRPIMKAVKYMLVSGVVWTNRPIFADHNVLTVPTARQLARISRISMIPTDLLIPFKWLQFPVKVSFALTINVPGTNFQICGNIFEQGWSLNTSCKRPLTDSTTVTNSPLIEAISLRPNSAWLESITAVSASYCINQRDHCCRANRVEKAAHPANCNRTCQQNGVAGSQNVGTIELCWNHNSATDATRRQKFVLTKRNLLGSPLVDDRPIMNAVKYRVVSGVVWTNRTMVSSNTDTNRPGVLAVVDIGAPNHTLSDTPWGTLHRLINASQSCAAITGSQSERVLFHIRAAANGVTTPAPIWAVRTWSNARMKGRGKREIPEKTRDSPIPARFPITKARERLRPGIEPGSLSGWKVL
ncbi:hypothetical protein PR048_033525 [Dryococelus australis]|uniref:DNA helicase Pif1-like 2B domain-containing protein n=1 Tax=Dryococelus australis TaxID=614101 RepID=A0ABQ9G0J3_9NEOP|nr:hypothetical protein PR048_033525 [Dryococelus australis]